MHVHARGTPAVLSDDEAWLTLYIANGITGVREMGGDYVETVFRWRAETAKGERLGPRILSSGPKVEGPKPKLPGSFGRYPKHTEDRFPGIERKAVNAR
jgi:hypothetical protein